MSLSAEQLARIAENRAKALAQQAANRARETDEYSQALAEALAADD